MTEMYCWCITDIFADVSVRSLSPVMATGTPQLVWRRLLVTGTGAVTSNE